MTERRTNADWQAEAQAFAEGVGDLPTSAAAWIWSPDGERMLWANAAGGRAFGAASFAELAGRRWPAGDPLRRDLRNLGRGLGDKWAMARLRIAPGLDRLPATYRVRRVKSTTGSRGLLVESLGAAARDGGGAVDFRAPAKHPVTHPTAEAAPASIASAASQSARSDPDTAVASKVSAPSPKAHDRPPEGAVSEPGAGAWEKVAAELPGWVRSGFGLPNGPENGNGRDLRLVPSATPDDQRETPRSPPASERSVSAGRVDRELDRKPVRFLWQTDSADRFLFVSPGLAQVVGRSAEIVGERWADLTARLWLDPSGRIATALAERDTWSGLTAWWPVEGSGVRVPAELTALPVFGSDHSFQGYRGFGVLRPAEALMPATFAARHQAEGAPLPNQAPPDEEAPVNVVPIRGDVERRNDLARLSPQERIAFEEIAASLHARVGGGIRADKDTHAPDDLFASAPRVQEAMEPEKLQPHADTAIGADPGLNAPDVPATSASEADMPAAPEEHRPADEGSAGGASARVEALEEKQPPAVVRTPSRAADDELRRRLEEMTAILDTATDGILILDTAGTIEQANASAEALFGLEAAELQGMLFVDLLTEESRIAALDYLGGLKEHGVASLLNEGREVEAKAGARAMPLFLTLGRISSDNGGRYCALLRDLTHWKRTEADLIAARRRAETASSQKSDFLARVSHEIRTPLNAVIGFAEVMIEERFGAIGNDRYREYLRDIRVSGEHVVSLVNDLLDISKIEAGKLDLTFVAVPLNDIVRECITLMQPQAGRARVVLRSSLSREVPGIVADERTMRQIVLNLLSNSVKFTGPGGQVIASTSMAESGEAILRVRDTGEGMSEEELVRAMEPFRQITTSTMGNRAGTGLGLPLTKALVEANRASFEIRSTPGEGTVVKVTFPPTRVLSE